MNYFFKKTKLILSTISLSVIMLFASCDKNKHDVNDKITIIDITPMTESNAKKGIEISEEERETIYNTVINEGLLDDTETN